MGERKIARQGWCDWLRCLACVCVVILHATGGLIASGDVASKDWLALTALSALTRWAVPAFVMLSGAFLLDPDHDLPHDKWWGRVKKMALLTVIVAVFFALWDARRAHLGVEWLLEALIRLVKGEFHYHLWFLPMLLGLYLITPLLRAMVRGAGRRQLWYAVGLWAVFAICLPFLYRFLPLDVGLPWLERFELYGVFGYTGYYLLGYLLKTCEIRRGASVALWLAGLCGLVLTFRSTVIFSQGQGVLDARFLSYFSPFVALTAAAVFLFARRLGGGNHPIWARLSKLTLWVYLLHPLVLDAIL